MLYGVIDHYLIFPQEQRHTFRRHAHLLRRISAFTIYSVTGGYMTRTSHPWFHLMAHPTTRRPATVAWPIERGVLKHGPWPGPYHIGTDRRLEGYYSVLCMETIRIDALCTSSIPETLGSVDVASVELCCRCTDSSKAAQRDERCISKSPRCRLI